ncbi:ankyrin repeat-containing domain protein [Cokeromyces recurvatus]|uniref:ankyrin repeat-containing domain protein n=1 Tax=Cokeromyces recurvatus TaxID=90255 RepID=UPI00221ED457|nr:ankyrin repeat-containing domain protein [Cokeromyces recurvatus]KAI7905221.1 ankyrin repeat-containing domain protein [Cokeromyces recurvatus]
MDVNFLNGPHHELALHAACAKGLYDAVELLIENGSLLDTKDSLGHTPLTNAIFARSLPCIELLINYNGSPADVSVIDDQGNNLLHLAATNNFASAIPLLIKKGVPIDSHNQRWLSPLAVAISFGCLDAANALIEGGADVNGRTRFATVLHHAVTWNRLEVVKKLIELNCNVNVVNILEETPLYLAVQQRKIDIVRYLIEEGKADPCFTVNNLPNTSNLPLLYAANHGYTEICRLLITQNTSTFFIQTSANMSRRAGYPLTEEFLNNILAERQQITAAAAAAITIDPPIENNVDLNDRIVYDNGNKDNTNNVNNSNSVEENNKDDNDDNKEAVAAFESIFNTFSDDEL